MKKNNLEKDDMGNLSKNSKTLRTFVLYCLDNPDQRFWQALRNWSKTRFILKADTLDSFDGIKGIKDTFYDEE